MALITDPDQLLQGTEVTIDKAGLDFTLNLVGNLSEDGVTLQAFYSFLKEEWLNETNDVHKYTFPMLSITPEQFEIGNNGSKFSNWTWADDATRKLIRTAGWREYNDTGATTREYLGAITLGNIDATNKTVGDTVDYFFSSDSSSTAMTYAGAANEAIQIYGDATNGNFDKRSDVLTLQIRVQGKTYDSSTTTSIGVSTMTYKVERFPLSESTDNNISVDDIGIDSNSDGTADVAPYNGMSITYIDHDNKGAYVNATVYAANDVVQDVGDSKGNGADRWYITPGGGTSSGATVASDTGVTDWVLFSGERLIGSTYYAFGVVVQGNSGTSQQIYEFVQWSLRQTGDIDAGAGTQVGTLAEALIDYSAAPTLKTLLQSDGDGVVIDNFDTNYTNDLQFADDLNGGTLITFPFVAAGTLAFNTNIVDDVAAKYWLFFQDANGNLIDTDNAIIINNNSGTPITGTVTGQANIPFDYDYDNNVQGGRTAGTDATYVLRVIGLTTAQFAEVSGTIGRSVGQNISITSALERNYVNP